MQQLNSVSPGHWQSAYCDAQQHLEAAKIYLSEQHCYDATMSAARACEELVRAQLAFHHRDGGTLDEIVLCYKTWAGENKRTTDAHIELLNKAVLFLKQKEETIVSCQQAELFIGAVAKHFEQVKRDLHPFIE